MTRTNRLSWLDAAKGLGMIAVVAGHVTESSSLRAGIFLWHMPFFFFVAGYTFRPEPDLRKNLGDKAIRLLVPYLCFLVLLSIPDLVATVHAGTATAYAKFAATRLLGGRAVVGWLIVVWFVTCLFLTQQIVNLLALRLSPARLGLCMLLAMLLAYLNALLLPKVWLPWNANVCLMAAPLFYAGWQYRSRFDQRFEWPALLVAAVALPLAVTGSVQAFDMKYGSYGTPIASLIAALGIALALIAIFRRLPAATLPMRALAGIGEASLTIMFLHWPVQFAVWKGLGIEDAWTRTALGLAVPVVLHQFIRRYGPARALLLGSVQDFRQLAGRPAVQASST